ncbi:unnamed protein product [Caretta caretta]
MASSPSEAMLMHIVMAACKGSLCEQTEASTESSILPSDECFEQHCENIKYYLNLPGDILIPLLKWRHTLLHENSLQNKHDRRTAPPASPVALLQGFQRMQTIRSLTARRT